MTNEHHHSHQDHSHCDIEMPHHHHDFGKSSEQSDKLEAGKKVLTIRSHSGLAGDMFLCGLIRTLGLSSQETDNILNGIFPALK